MSKNNSSPDFDEIYKTYSGDEPFINNGVETSHSMLDYWQWTLSCIYESTTRGGFAEYIVKIALDDGGINLNLLIGKTCIADTFLGFRNQAVLQFLESGAVAVFTHLDDF